MTTASHHLAVYNFGIHLSAFGPGPVTGFSSREAANFEAAERSEGFIGRSGYPGEPGPLSWGAQVFPRFLKENGRDSGVSSLSLWRDIECLMAFTYTGVHADALKHARHWNEKQAWPPLVLFWVEAGLQPSWAQAVSRFERLADFGPAPDAFGFKVAFAATGEPYAPDHLRVKLMMQANLASQVDLLALVADLPV